jgi:hypothetical protein
MHHLFSFGTKLTLTLAWIPASAGMTVFSSTYHLRAKANRFAGSKHTQRNPCYSPPQNNPSKYPIAKKRTSQYAFYPANYTNPNTSTQVRCQPSLQPGFLHLPPLSHVFQLVISDLIYTEIPGLRMRQIETTHRCCR